MTSAIQEARDTSSVTLSAGTTSGLDSWAVESLKERVLDINGALSVAGKAINQVAADLYEIRQNITGKGKKGNWRAFMASGVLNCTPRYATDLVNAHEKWLIAADVDPALLAQMTPRTLSRLANATEAQRSKVFSAFKNCGEKERITEAKVNSLLTPNKKKSTAATKSVDERVSSLQATNARLLKQNRELQKQNVELKKMLVKAATEGVTPAVAAAV